MRFILFVITIALFSTSCDELMQENGGGGTPKTQPTPGKQTDPGQPGGSRTLDERDLRYQGKQVVLTRHARCRMDCRFIDAYEIQQVIDQNRINERKTQRDAQPCPSIAYEGNTRDNQRVRVIVGDCTPAKIITVIDLDNEFACSCD